MAGNSANSGGAIYAYKSVVNASITSIEGNTAHTAGGGVSLYTSTLLSGDSSMSGNVAPARGGGRTRAARLTPAAPQTVRDIFSARASRVCAFACPSMPPGVADSFYMGAFVDDAGKPILTQTKSGVVTSYLDHPVTLCARRPLRRLA